MNTTAGNGDFINTPSAVSMEFATREQRCINFIIDNIVMRFSLAYATGILFAWVLRGLFPSFAALVLREDEWLPVVVTTYMVSRVNYALYYSFCEKCFRGYTIGKYITGTRAIRNDGNELTILNAIHRSFSRFLPFEFLSGFSEKPWHDNWTNTVVIKAGTKPVFQ